LIGSRVMLGGCLGLFFRVLVDTLIANITARIVNWVMQGHLVDFLVKLLALLGIRVRKP